MHLATLRELYYTMDASGTIKVGGSGSLLAKRRGGASDWDQALLVKHNLYLSSCQGTAKHSLVLPAPGH
jgi:hypothetical protein